MRWVEASSLKCDLDYDQFTAVTINYLFHAGSGAGLVYNISDHCVVAILELLTSDCQRFLNQSRMCLYNWFTTFCQRWLKSEGDVIKLCYFPLTVAIILSRFCLCHVLPYFTKRNQRPTTHTQLKKQSLHKDVSIQRRRNPCYGHEIHVAKRIW